jgi:septal ring factor EnvC (AmiA/AmiB activator)
VNEQEPPEHGLRDRLSTAGEEAFGELAQNLLENPFFNQALATALGAGERVLQAQRSAMTALNVPSGSDIERLERRVRSVSDRLELLEDRLDEVADDMAELRRRLAATENVATDQARFSVPDPGEGS